MEVSKLEINQPLESSYLTAHLEIDSFRPNPRYYNTQYTQRKNREILDKEGCSFWWSFGLEHFVQRLFSHTTLVGLLYPGGDKSEKVCTDYEV